MLIAITATMMTPTLAADYEFDPPDGPMYASPTSVDQVIVVGEGTTDRSNVDRSKNAAVIAPPFGSPESYLPGAGTVLIPQASTSSGTTAGSSTIYLPPASYDTGTPAEDTSPISTKFTLPDGLYYSDGSLGRLRIPSLGLSVKVYEDESLESLAKGAGHFKSTSCWDGNVGLCSHNVPPAGAVAFFRDLHLLEAGDTLTYQTAQGERQYQVTEVREIAGDDWSYLSRTDDNRITMITCITGKPDLRLMVQAREI